LGISLFSGAATGCHAGTWLQFGCQNTTFRETKTSSGDLLAKRANWPASPGEQAASSGGRLTGDANSNAPPAGAAIASASGESLAVNLGTETSVVTRHQLAGARFNLAAFQACMLFCTFGLAFSRWMIENRHSAMSELFERKKEVNLLLLNDDKGVFKPLVSEALKPYPGGSREPVEPRVLQVAECRKCLAAVIRGGAASGSIDDSVGQAEGATAIEGQQEATADSDDNTEFLRQMFVYIELDNFELALNRYVAGLLAPEQMNRAREIIESRCANQTFRYMAAAQGLKYYTDTFHWALKHILIRTEYVASMRAGYPSESRDTASVGAAHGAAGSA
jgi:hypothetical protein